MPPSYGRRLPRAQDVDAAIEALAPGDVRKPATALERFYRWLAHEPHLEPGEGLSLWHLRPGDTVEIVSHVRHRPNAEVLATARVVAADQRTFKLEDGRVFDQRGWPTFSGRKSPIRARRAGR